MNKPMVVGEEIAAEIGSCQPKDDVEEGTFTEEQVNFIVNTWSKLVAERDLEIQKKSDLIDDMVSERAILAESLEKQGKIIKRCREQIEELGEENARLMTENNNLRAKLDDSIERMKRLDESLEMSNPVFSNLDFVTIKIPVASTKKPFEQRIAVQRNMDYFAREIESSSFDWERATESLLGLVQEYVGLIHADLVELVPGQDARELTRAYMQDHNSVFLANAHQEVV